MKQKAFSFNGVVSANRKWQRTRQNDGFSGSIPHRATLVYLSKSLCSGLIAATAKKENDNEVP
jgi:hypothetical protein